MRDVLLDEVRAGRRLKVEVGPHDGRIQISVGVHREVDGRGVWLNVSPAEARRVARALEDAVALADGDAG